MFGDSWFDTNGPTLFLADMVVAIILVAIIAIFSNHLKSFKHKGSWEKRNEYTADLAGWSLFISIVFSIIVSLMLAFSGFKTMLCGVSAFAPLFLALLFASTELALSQYTMKEQWQQPIILTSLGIICPIVIVAAIDTCIWLLQFGVGWAFVGVVAAFGLFYGVIRLWELIDEWKSNKPVPAEEYVPSPVSRASFMLKLDFSSNLKKLREAARRTEESVARKAGLPVGELRKIESCMNNFNMSAAFACLKTLDHHIEVENECGSVALYSASDALSWLAGMVCGLSVEQVASDAGISPTMLGFAIDGKIPLSIDVFAGICSLFGASVKFVRNRQELQVAKK